MNDIPILLYHLFTVVCRILKELHNKFAHRAAAAAAAAAVVVVS
ncbi:MAG: hypothetical protein ACI90V_003683 [Bacillariaceae sp.]|jgi:hypothetical protein